MSNTRSTNFLTAPLASTLILCLALQSQSAEIVLNDNGVHTVNDDQSDNWYNVFGSTTLNVVPGANIGGSVTNQAFAISVRANAGSTVNVTDGTFFGDLQSWGSMSVAGGSFGDDVRVLGGTGTVSGGDIADELSAHNGATLNWSGGSVQDEVHARTSSTINVFGGSVEDILIASEGGLINIFGNVAVGEDLVSNIDQDDNLVSSIVIYGTSVQVNGLPVGPGPISPAEGTISGILNDGSSFSWDFRRTFTAPGNTTLVVNGTNGGSIVVAVPEPAQVLMLTLVGISIALYRLRRLLINGRLSRPSQLATNVL